MGKLHKTQEVAKDILLMFDKNGLMPEEAFMVIALVFRQMGVTLSLDPQHLMKLLHTALVDLAKSTKDTEIQDLIYKLD